MKFYGDIDLNHNLIKNTTLESLSEFPSPQGSGMIVFKNNKVFISIEISQNNFVWVPLTNEISLVTHEQNEASTTWTINHSFGGASVLVQVQDSAGYTIIPDFINSGTPNVVTISFSEAITGKAVAIFDESSNETSGPPPASSLLAMLTSAESTQQQVNDHLATNEGQTDLTNLVASETDFQQVIDFSGALTKLVTSTTGAEAVAGSTMAMTKIAESQSALNEVSLVASAISAFYANVSAWNVYIGSAFMKINASHTGYSTGVSAPNQFQPGTVSASSEFNTTYRAWHAFNDPINLDAAVIWHNVGGNSGLYSPVSNPEGEWLKYAFTVPTHITRATLRIRNDQYPDPQYQYTRTVEIQYSDNNADWTTAATFLTPRVGGGASFEIDVPAAGKHQFWRIKFLDYHDQPYSEVGELRFLGLQ